MVKSIHDLFESHLKEVYFIEKFLVKSLQNLKQKATSDDAKELFEEHKKETEEHVNRIKEIFNMSTIEEEELESRVWETMDSELEGVFEKEPTPEAADFLVLEAAAKSERLEISYYETLLLLGQQMDELDNQKEIVDRIKENLSEEESALKKVTSLAKSKVSLIEKFSS